MTRVGLFRMAVALIVLGGVLTTGPRTAVQAQTRAFASCGQTTLGTASIINGSNNSTAGTLYLIKDTCTNSVFARTVDPWWFSYANACVDTLDPSNRWIAQTCGYGHAGNQQWYPFGGTIDSPEVKLQSGYTYSAMGEQNGYAAYLTYKAP